LLSGKQFSRREVETLTTKAANLYILSLFAFLMAGMGNSTQAATENCGVEGKNLRARVVFRSICDGSFLPAGNW
jgi:hypothetical protein